jgi:hypothetical protein
MMPRDEVRKSLDLTRRVHQAHVGNRSHDLGQPARQSQDQVGPGDGQHGRHEKRQTERRASAVADAIVEVVVEELEAGIVLRVSSSSRISVSSGTPFAASAGETLRTVGGIAAWTKAATSTTPAAAPTVFIDLRVRA